MHVHTKVTGSPFVQSCTYEETITKMGREMRGLIKCALNMLVNEKTKNSRNDFSYDRTPVP